MTLIGHEPLPTWFFWPSTFLLNLIYINKICFFFFKPKNFKQNLSLNPECATVALHLYDVGKLDLQIVFEKT